ncbi:MAG: HD domain-containing protein [Clostridium sp.]
MKIDINIPSTANYIIDKLYEAGYEGFVVGGCVRDSVLGVIPNDWDICTSCSPQGVIDIFKSSFKVIETGLKHGTVTLVDGEDHYEITTYRIDGEYEGSRRPKQVEFTSSLKEDLARRDFTINAMAYNHREGLVDYFNGVEDIEKRVIRCVGVADKRFGEDALRILRAYRFKSKLGFNLDRELINGVINNYQSLSLISRERIQSELSKIITNSPYVLQDMYLHGVLQEIIPEFKGLRECTQENPYHYTDVFNHTVDAMAGASNNLAVRLALLLHDIGKPSCKTIDENGVAHFYRHSEASCSIAEGILKGLKYDNKTISKVLTLIKYHDCELTSTRSIKRMLNRIGLDNLEDLLEVKLGDAMGQSELYREDKIKGIQEVKSQIHTILETKQCFTVKDLDIKGNDLITLGVKQGRDIGIVLNKLLDMVIEDRVDNKKEELISIINKGELNLNKNDIIL